MMITCPKCGKLATERVVARDGQCSACTETDRLVAAHRDTFAHEIVRGDRPLADPDGNVIPEKYADWVWSLAEALAKRRPR